MKFSHILVPVTGAPLDEEVIQLACQIVRRDKAKLWLLHVIELQRALPLNAENAAAAERAERILERAETLAGKAGVRAETDLLQARHAGAALVDAAAERGVDLIVLGLPFRRKPDQLYLGGTTLYVLNQAPCRVWICRALADGEAGRAGGA
jgi:nucleotide-binding universal stress UspA family protein